MKASTDKSLRFSQYSWSCSFHYVAISWREVSMLRLTRKFSKKFWTRLQVNHDRFSIAIRALATKDSSSHRQQENHRSTIWMISDIQVAKKQEKKEEEMIFMNSDVILNMKKEIDDASDETRILLNCSIFCLFVLTLRCSLYL